MKEIDLLLINPLHLNKVGILSIATYVKKEFSVEIIDGTVEEIKNKISKIFESGTKVNLVGITATSDCINMAYKICEFIKSISDVYCALGGFHATALSEKSLLESKFDIVVVGEGEQTTLELLRKIKEGKFPTGVAGTVEKTSNGIILNKPRELIKNLDDIPFPDFGLVNINDYLHEIRNYRGDCKRTLCLLISRGCPFNCAFCASATMWKRRLRFFSMDRVIEWLNFLVEKYKIDGFSFLDDDLMTDKKRFIEFCNKLISSGLAKKIVWSCQARADSVDGESIKKMKEAGGILIRFGIESGDQKSLDFLKQGTTTVEQNKKAVKLCKEGGILCFATFIIGSPDENIEGVLNTIKFIEETKLDGVDVFIATPLPATKLWEVCEERGYIQNFDWYDISKMSGVLNKSLIRNKYFTAEQLKNIKNYIYINIVFPTNARKKLKSLDHRKEIEKILAGNTRMAVPTKVFKLKELSGLFSSEIKNPRKFLTRIRNIRKTYARFRELYC